jgi:hypothetical protein
MKVLDFVTSCRGNVRFILDGEGPAINQIDFIKLHGAMAASTYVATVTFDPDGCGGVICEISTIYEDNGQA